MIELYHCPDARSFRCLWLLEELQLPYRLHQLEFPPRFKAPDYLQRNPVGTVPLLVDAGETLFESAAILQYLSTRHGPTSLVVAADEAGYASHLNWLHFGEASLTTNLAVMLRYAIFEPEPKRLPQVVEFYRGVVDERLKLVAAALEAQDYLSAGRFTIADISVGYSLMLSRLLGLHKSWPPTLHAYWDRLRARPAFNAAKQAQQVVAD